MSLTSAHSFAGPARAQWVDSSHLIVKLPQGLHVADGMRFSLADSGMSLSTNSVISLPLTSNDYTSATLNTSSLDRGTIDALIQRPLRLFITNAGNQVLDSTAIQYAGLLDQLYYYDGNDLGAHYNGSQFSLKLWAPTAQQVRVMLFANGSQDSRNPLAIVPLQRQQGVWSATLPSQYKNSFYLYEVQVYQPLTDRVETTLVTDPYSVSLTTNGMKSQLIDIDSSELKPSSWDSFQKPNLNSFNDMIIYELHIRDFSANDGSVPFPYRGGYLAFAQNNSVGVQHLQSLAQSGLTHVHLMPFNDFGTVNEDKTSWQSYSSLSSSLEDPQNVIGHIRTADAFNWGYDPVHFMAPEGSYATDPDGSVRVREVRTMVQSLNQMGLRVIQDVVFNHTYKNGMDQGSVFDKIVPLYYYRLNDEGDVLKSSCCFDTASEHHMMEKLMIDGVVSWAKNYKIDGFRFDLMGFHSKDTMERLKIALGSLTQNHDGIDGTKIFVYGEGWSFGSLFDKDPSSAMTIENSFGSGIAVFNDRLRDAVRGGTTNSVEKSDQGFATGLFFDFNQEPANRNTPADLGQQKEKLLLLGDVIKVGLAGNLRDFTFREHGGRVLRAGDLQYRNESVGTASQATETINYVSAHDGYTLWDAVQAKAPFYTPGRNPALTSSEDRQRMHQLAMAIPLLGQGIPFIEGGTELLRSKNGDQDSYDSGDFFNRIDWTDNNNYWGEALPPAWKNYDDWSFWQPRLQESGMKTSPDLIARTDNYFKALLKFRQSSSLFKMNGLDDIMTHLVFIDTEGGNTNEPGLIAMALHRDPEAVLIFFNASRESRVFTHSLLQYPWALHPLFGVKVDPVLSQVVLDPAHQRIQIPGRTTVILQLQGRN